ncbi:MAG: ribonuclease P protein component [Burkholderiales bacterium]|nr:ribonuclease P protein component [Burkholderiales bacterium]
MSTQRILQRAQFDAVMSSGPPVAKTVHFALHMAKSHEPGGVPDLFPGGGAWLGVLVPKRWARRAVTRNTLRRQIYAVARELTAGLPQLPMVVRLRSGFSRDDFPSATSDALKREARAELLLLLGERLARRQWAPVVAAPPAPAPQADDAAA